MDTSPVARAHSSAARPPSARRRPAAYRCPGALALNVAYRALGALVIAAPASALVATLVGGYPRGDAVVFDAGGLMLLEVVRLARLAEASLAAQIGLGALLFGAAGLLPLAILIVALGHDGPLSAPFVAGSVARALGPLSLLWGVALAAEVTAAAIVLLFGAKLVGLLALGPRADDLAHAAVALTAVLAVAAIGVTHDLARICAVHEGCGFYASASRALEASRRAPLAFAWSYVWRGVATLLVLACAAWLAHRAGVATTGRVALGFAIHQTALAAAVFLRASWLAAAMVRLERTLRPAPGRPQPPSELSGPIEKDDRDSAHGA